MVVELAEVPVEVLALVVPVLVVPAEQELEVEDQQLI